MIIRHYTEATKYREKKNQLTRLGYAKSVEAFIRIDKKTGQLWKDYADYDAPAGFVDWYILETIDEIPADMYRLDSSGDVIPAKKWWQFWKK